MLPGKADMASSEFDPKSRAWFVRKFLPYAGVATLAGIAGATVDVLLSPKINPSEDEAKKGFSYSVVEDEEKSQVLAGIGPSVDRGYKVVAKNADNGQYSVVSRPEAKVESPNSFEKRLVVKGTWDKPVSTSRTNVNFGDYNGGGRQPHHTGVDFSASMNTHVMSVDDGIVHYFGWWPVGTEPDGHGLTLGVYHGVGDDGRPVYSVYAHLNGLIEGIEVGKQVSKDEDVALSGKTGFGNGCSGCNTPHLHFAVAREWSPTGLTWSDTNNPWDNPDNYFA